MNISQDQLMKHSEGRYSAEASELRLPVGVWPRAISVAGLGEFDLAERITDQEGEFGGYRYADQAGKVVVTIFND